MDSDRKHAWFQMHSQVTRPLEALRPCSHQWVAAHSDFEPNRMNGGKISNRIDPDLHGFRLFRFRLFPNRFPNSDLTKGTTASPHKDGSRVHLPKQRLVCALTLSWHTRLSCKHPRRRSLEDSSLQHTAASRPLLAQIS